MSTKKEATLRLNMPQWQGGNRHDYYFGSELLAWLAPPADGPVETVPVPEPRPGETLEVENGIVGREALLRQARAAREAIEKHCPDRIVTLGGDCLIDLAPMAYLNRRYGGNLGVLWVDAHPDVLTPKDFAHAQSRCDASQVHYATRVSQSVRSLDTSNWPPLPRGIAGSLKIGRF